MSSLSNDHSNLSCSPRLQYQNSNSNDNSVCPQITNLLAGFEGSQESFYKLAMHASYLSHAEAIIAATQPVTSEEVGEWFAARAINWLISALQNFKKGNLLTAYIQHLLARFFDYLSSIPSERLASTLKVDTKDISLLLNRNDREHVDVGDDGRSTPGELRFRDVSLSTPVPSEIDQRLLDLHIAYHSASERLISLDMGQNINPEAQKHLDDAERAQEIALDAIFALEKMRSESFVIDEAPALLESAERSLKDLQNILDNAHQLYMHENSSCTNLT